MATRFSEDLSTIQSPSDTFVLVLCTCAYDILGTVVERDTLMSSFGIDQDRCFILL